MNNNRKSKKIVKRKNVKAGIMVASVILLGINPLVVSAASTSISFPSSSLQNQTKSITLPSNFDSVTSISVDNGDVSYKVNGSTMDVTVDNGTAISSDSILNPTKYQKPASTFLYSNQNDLPSTAPYNDEDGYEGNLNMVGTPEVISGSYLPGDSKTVTHKEISPYANYFQNVFDYNQGGYTGTLTKNGEPIKIKIDGDSFIQDKKTVTTDKTLETGRTSKYRFRFDGSNYIQLPDQLKTFGETDFTIEGWFDVQTESNATILAVNGTGNGKSDSKDNQLVWGIWTGKYNLDEGSYDSDGKAINLHKSPEDAKLFERVHLAVAVKGNTMSFYENGILKWTEATVGRNNYSYDRAPTLGMESDLTKVTDFFKGYMYEVRLYNRALSRTEVERTVVGTTARDGLLAEYLFNEGSGNIIKDHSGNGYNGTIVGNQVWDYFSETPAPTFPATDIYDDSDYRGTINKTGTGAFYFDGATYIQLPDSLMFWGQGSNDITFEGWFDIDSSANSQVFYAKNGEADKENQLVLHLFKGQITVDVGRILDGNSIATGWQTYYYPPRDKKVHLAFVIKNDVATVYANGVSVFSEKVVPRTNMTDLRAPQLGMETDGGEKFVPSQFFKGRMHEVRMYNEGLSATQINNNMKGKVYRGNLAAEYLFNEGSGKVIKDHSGNNNDGVVVGNAVWNNQKFSTRLNFNGNTYVQLPEKMNTIGEGNSDIAVEGWFELSPKGGSDAIYGLNGSLETNDNNMLIGIYENVTHINVRQGGLGESVMGKGYPVVRGKKVHLVHMIQNNVAKLYIDGVLVKSDTISPRDYSYEEGPKLGTDFDNWVPSDFYQGYMYEVRVYNRSLTDTEIKNNMNGDIAKTGLQAEYLLNEGKGRVITDHSGNGNNGEIVGDVIWEKYAQNYTYEYSGDVIRYIVASSSIASIDNNFADSISYVDRNGFKGTIYKDGAATKTSDGQYVQNYSGIVYSQTFDSTQYEYHQMYTGTVSGKAVDTRIWRANYEGTAYKGEYEPANQKYAYNVTISYSVFSGSATCSYKNQGPPSTTVNNYLPKCISVTKTDNDLYKMLYNFSVTGISAAGEK